MWEIFNLLPNMEINNRSSGFDVPVFLPNVLAKRNSRFSDVEPCPAKKAKVEGQGKMEKGAESLFVRNLPFDTTADDLKSLFTDANDISLPLFKNGKNRGKSRGFAFITFQTEALAEVWLQQTQGAEIHGRTITVGLATGPTKTLIVNGLCERTTDKTLIDSFGGAIGAKIVTDEETGSSKGVGFVDFDNEQACQAAKESMKDAEIDGNRVTLSYGTRRGPTKTLYVTGLCAATTDKTLMDTFEGAIGAKVVTDTETGFSKGFGFVIFDNRRACQAAQEAMKNGMIDATMDTKQIIHYAIQMEKLNTERSFGDLAGLLSDLDNTRITVEQLQNTDIVSVLYKILKTCSDESVTRAVKRLLSKWKKLYGHSDQTSRDTRAATPRKDKGRLSGCAGVTDHSADTDDNVADTQVDVHMGPTHNPTWDGGGEKPTAETTSSLKVEQSPTISSVRSGSETPGTLNAAGDFSLSALRSRCVRLLLCALIASETPDSSSPEPEEEVSMLARDIEQSIHNLHAANQLKYKACVRSKVANLRNPKSGHLRQGLLSGSLKPEAFTRMSAEEMASEELKRLREEYTSRAVSERQLPRGLEGTPTRKIRCRRCDSLDSTVTQVSRGILFLPAWAQRGGPDTDAMTFVTCSGCGEQWYHSGWNCL